MEGGTAKHCDGAVVPCSLPCTAAAIYWNLVLPEGLSLHVQYSYGFKCFFLWEAEAKQRLDCIWLSYSRFHLLLLRPASELLGVIFIDCHIVQYKGVTVQLLCIDVVHNMYT